MSPTSYQTAPPRDLMITTDYGVVKLRAHAFRQNPPDVANCKGGGRACLSVLWSPLALQFRSLASIHDLCRIDCRAIYLFFQNTSVLAN